MTKIKLTKAENEPRGWLVGDFFTLNSYGWVGVLVYNTGNYFIYWFKENTATVSCDNMEGLQKQLKHLVTYIPNVEIIY